MLPYEPTYSFNLGPRRDDPSLHCVEAPIPQPPEIPDDVWYFLLAPETYYCDGELSEEVARENFIHKIEQRVRQEQAKQQAPQPMRVGNVNTARRVTVKPGQIWRDTSTEARGRRFRIMHVRGGDALVRTLNVRDSRTGRYGYGPERTIRLDRLHHSPYKIEVDV